MITNGSDTPGNAPVAAVRDWITHTRTHLYAIPETDLPDLFTDLLALRAQVEGLAVATLLEAESRGVIAASTASGTAGWVQARATEAGVQVTGPEAGAWQRVAREAQAPDMTVYADAVTTGRVGVPGAAVLARELRRIRDLVPAATWDACAGEVIDYAAAGASPAQLAGLRDIVITQYGEDPDYLLRRERAAFQAREFTTFRTEPNGSCTARLRLDPGMAAIVQAAMQALAAPNPARATGTDPLTGTGAGPLTGAVPGVVPVRDERTAGQRRADAFVDLCRAFVDHPDVVAAARPGAAGKAHVVVTMDFERLREACGYGLTEHQQPLSPATVRAFACDAQVIPMVLGSNSEILDQGRTERTATPGQVAHLRKRDRGCTFPGCDRPPDFCQAHHIRHWVAHTGPTDVDNMALLCAAHHLVVHRDGYTAHVTPTGVTWTDATDPPA